MENKKIIEKEINKFKKASEIDPNQFAYNMRERILALWGKCEIIVRCPKCGKTQKVKTVKIVKCFNCNNNFQVCPKNKPTRIVWCNNTPILHEIERLELDAGNYHNIF